MIIVTKSKLLKVWMTLFLLTFVLSAQEIIAQQQQFAQQQQSVQQQQQQQAMQQSQPQQSAQQQQTDVETLRATSVPSQQQILPSQQTPQKQMLPVLQNYVPRASAQQSITQQTIQESEDVAETPQKNDSRKTFFPKSLLSYLFSKQQPSAIPYQTQAEQNQSAQKNAANQNLRPSFPQNIFSGGLTFRSIQNNIAQNNVVQSNIAQNNIAQYNTAQNSSHRVSQEMTAANGMNRMNSASSMRRLNNNPNTSANAVDVADQNKIPRHSASAPIQNSESSAIQTAAGELPNRHAFAAQHAYQDVTPPRISTQNGETNEIIGVSGLLPRPQEATHNEDAAIAEKEIDLPEYRPLPLRKNNEKETAQKSKSNTNDETNSENDSEENIAESHLSENKQTVSSDEYSLASAVQDEEESRRAVTTARSASRSEHDHEHDHDHDHEHNHDGVPHPHPDNMSEEELLHEINAASMKSAAFNGIIPGVSTRAELMEMMGEPNKTSSNGEFEICQYVIEDLGTIDVTLKNGKVFSLMLGFPEPYPAEQIREQFETELRGIRSILIPDANNNILGQLFPEKGVVFEFLPSEKPGEPSLMVTNLAIEPITAVPFVIRGERYLTIANSKAKWDLTIAVQLDPNNDRARWLLAKAFLADGQLAKAQREAIFAIKINDQDLQYHVTLAEIIGKAGHIKEARQYLDEILPYCENAPQVRGKAECLMGDFYRDDSELLDFATGNKYHLQAIETIKPLINAPNSTMRQQAKMINLQAYLSSVMDISWSNWGDKEKALQSWLKSAKDIALDLVIKEKVSRECLLDVATTAISAYQGCPESDDFIPYIREAENVADEIIGQNVDDKNLTQKIEKELGMAYNHAEQIYEIRKDYKQALKYGKKAVEHLERGINNRSEVIEIYNLANIYYQLGRIQATGLSNDKEAIIWFTKAIPFFQQVEPRLDDSEQPRLGEIYVSIGVSYWNIGERDYALKISEYGIGKLEKAVEQKLVPEKILAIPYENLSAMYEKVGRTEEAKSYYILSKSANSGGTGSSVR